MTSKDRRAARHDSKRTIRQRKKEKLEKKMTQQLQNKGQTKHEYNLMKKGLSNLKRDLKTKNQTSVKFTKSAQFFENLEVTNNLFEQIG